MSYTIIYKVPEKGELEVAAEIQNAWRGAVNIWTELYDHYLIPHGVIVNLEMEHAHMMCNMQRVWDLRNRADVHLAHKIVLLTTFDRVMVSNADLPRVIEAIKVWHMEPGSLPEQRDVLEHLYRDPDCFAVCWNQTSVTDAWQVYEGDDTRMYDLARDTGHWFLFDHPSLNG